ncbi:WecB/TagA/CpsF family glycosyltransferase [Urechidicola croceus]|uniref:Glycosyltransferase n=1 Tax=Urechidicola croceus TaxID=1850246 RepID=A0A1D8P9F1_9FLAO|nr:WecB/TagA/CpsF family glycosyltransferase [Urechidicola croceus]AOW21175.1 hypothetical protein LPB138_11010 [Urechidicola croceus]
MEVKINNYNVFSGSIDEILELDGKIVINTINAHSYITAEKDKIFKEALVESDVLLPDGEGVVLMAKYLNNIRINKIAGADMHQLLLKHVNKNNLKCFYLGSSENVLNIIRQNLNREFPNINIATFSPPFKEKFTEKDNEKIITAINNFEPDVLFVGMTAPKQEKWLFQNKEHINFKFAAAIGAVFDFYAETKSRAPKWVIKIKMEWLYRAFSSWRLAKRYIYSNPKFIIEVIKLKFLKVKNN